MDFLITFFRDILDGPVYIIVAVISGILICSCIGYLAERSLKQKEKQKEYAKAAEISIDANIDSVVVKNVDGFGSNTIPVEEVTKNDNNSDKTNIGSDVKLDINQDAIEPKVEDVKLDISTEAINPTITDVKQNINNDPIKPTVSVNTNNVNNQNIVK